MSQKIEQSEWVDGYPWMVHITYTSTIHSNILMLPVSLFFYDKKKTDELGCPILYLD